MQGSDTQSPLTDEAQAQMNKLNINRGEEQKQNNGAVSQDPSQQYQRHKLAHANGGLILLDEGNIIPQAFKEILSKLGKKMMKGEFQDMMKTPAPAYMHYPRTYLEGSAVDLSLAPKYFKQASESIGALERLKWVVATYIGGHHINVSQMQCRAPLNPILGETIQRVLPTGEKYYAEQTSHHPPITNFLLEGPDNAYKFYGHFEYKAWPSGLSSISGSRVGKQIIEFHDGGRISITDPTIQISGLTYGDRIHNYIGNAIYRDEVNKIEAEIIYNPTESTGYLSSLKSKWWSSKKQPLTDIIEVRISQVSDSGQKVLLETGTGSWLSHLEFNGETYWQLSDVYNEWLLPQPIDGSEEAVKVLPSDSQNRGDMKNLIDRNFDQAEKNKIDMEELQRHDKKLRVAVKKRRAQVAKAAAKQ
eukprot:403347716